METTVCIRQTAITTFLRCPHQYYLRYVKDIIAPPGIAAVAGTAVHKAMDRFWAQKNEGVVHVDEGIEIAMRHFAEEAKSAYDDCLDEKIKRYQREIPAIVRNGAAFVANVPFHALEQERQLAIRFDNVVVNGTLDLIDSECRVLDHKTGKHQTAATVNKSLQLTAYTALYRVNFGALPMAVGHIHLKNDGVDMLVSERTEEDVKRYLDIVYQVTRAIMAGAFPPCDPSNPANWWCNPRFCGYHPRGPKPYCPFGL